MCALLINRRVVFTLLVLTLTSAASPAEANPAVQRALRGTGWIVVPRGQGPNATSSGTCWVVDQERRLVVTNWHVVREFLDIRVYFPTYHEGRVITAVDHYRKNVTPLRGRVIATDARRDLALIQLASLPDDVRALPLAPQSPNPGQTVYSIGNSTRKSGRLWGSFTGKVRSVAFEEKKLGEVGVVKVRRILSDSGGGRGDSGGPLFDGQGQLVGVRHAHGREPLLVYSIDVTEVRAFLAYVKKRQPHLWNSAPSVSRVMGDGAPGWPMRLELPQINPITGVAELITQSVAGRFRPELMEVIDTSGIVIRRVAL
jgi:serine protease Do